MEKSQRILIHIVFLRTIFLGTIIKMYQPIFWSHIFKLTTEKRGACECVCVGWLS